MDVEIARKANMKRISDVAASLGIDEKEIIPYGWYKAKLCDPLFEKIKSRPDGKLILVTAVNPTPAGEGKTTVTVGLGQALTKIGKKAIIALREPSLGPVFGMKGGATGGGYSQVVPMEDINLHFTGDIHAVTAANNLMCAMLDNHIQQGNTLNIDQRTVCVKRAMDMNDRALRSVVVGLGGKNSGIPREDGFNISVASEVMAILCLSRDISDLKDRLGSIILAYSVKGEPVYCRDLECEGAMAALLKEAILPNLVQTLENTPCLIHGGPFANIAHGCNSIRATKYGLKLADYLVTEAGFGSDLGAEKFFDIKCRQGGLSPSAAVLVVTIRALKYNGGVGKDDLKRENLEAVRIGSANLLAHIKLLENYNVPIVVAINHFDTDTESETAYVRDICQQAGVDCVLSTVYDEGGHGGIELAERVAELAEMKNEFSCLYPLDIPVKEKINIIATRIYGAKGVNYSKAADSEIDRITRMGRGNIPVCIAKTQYSFSDDPKMLCRPVGFEINIREIRLSNGAEKEY